MQNSQKDALSRRAFVGKLATGAAGAAIAIVATTGRSNAIAGVSGVASGNTGDMLDGRTEAEMQPAILGETRAPAAAESTQAPAPWNVLRPLAVGSVVLAPWRVTDLDAPSHGSCVLTLGNDLGQSHRVHICRNDGQPRGLVYTDNFDLVVMNGGRGGLPTDENLGQAVAAVAHVMAANERTPRARELADTLLAQAERESQFAGSAVLR